MSAKTTISEPGPRPSPCQPRAAPRETGIAGISTSESPSPSRAAYKAIGTGWARLSALRRLGAVKSWSVAQAEMDRAFGPAMSVGSETKRVDANQPAFPLIFQPVQPRHSPGPEPAFNPIQAISRLSCLLNSSPTACTAREWLASPAASAAAKGNAVINPPAQRAIFSHPSPSSLPFPIPRQRPAEPEIKLFQDIPTYPFLSDHSLHQPERHRPSPSASPASPVLS